VAVTCHDYFSVLARPVRRVGETAAEPPPCPGYVGPAEAAEAFAFHRRDLADELRAAHLLFAPSRAQAEGIARLAGAGLGALLLAPPPAVGEPLRRMAAGPARGRRLLAWGSLYPEKGIESVLEALARVPAALGYTLTVLGEAHEPAFRARIEARAQGLPVAWRGRFTPQDLEACAADYALLPTLADESYGLVLDEAMQLGLPTLAADVPAYRERARPESCAFYPPGDSEALAELLRQPALLERLERPRPPVLPSADAAAAELLAHYRRADRTAPFTPAVTDAERTAVVFRRAERRLWSALQQPDPPAPPW
jgi:glycosyltransferase involved in cell wall biosynthesis